MECADELYIEGRVAKPVRQDSGYNERSKLGLLQQVSSMSDTYMVSLEVYEQYLLVS